MVSRCFLRKENATKKLFIDFSIFWPFLTKNGQNWQKWRKLAKSKPFNEIFWNLLCRCLLVNKSSPQSPIFAFFGLFFTKKGRNWQKWRKLAKSKPFDEIFWNLVCRCFPTKENATNFFLDFGLFWPFFNQKTAKIDQKLRKLAKSKLFDEIF